MTDVRKIPIHEIPEKQRDHIQSLMKAGNVPGISIATVSSDGKIEATALGLADTKSETKVNADTQFWACSLSKPVFAYLVIKLIEDGTLPSDFLEEKISFNGKELTPRMMLSHQTGLPNEGPPDVIFDKPEKIFRYSGEGYLLLQKIIKERTGKGLNELAEEKIFGPLGMARSTFLFPEDEINIARSHNDAMSPNPIPKQPANDDNSAGSLHSTASDYARFLRACMADPKFVAMIAPQIKDMAKDIDSTEEQKGTKKPKVSSETLKSIDWGLGFGLEKDKKGKVVSAFHWGHGPGTRAFFSINLKENSAVVYLTNSENGMAISEEIAKSTIGSITPTMKFLSEKYGYRNVDSPGWKEFHEILMTGVAKEKEGNFDQAILAYQNALKLRPDKKHELEYRIMWAEAQKIKKISAGPINLENFIGQYGPLKIFLTGPTLQIEVGDPKGPHDLKVIDDNTLLDGDVIVKINRSPDGSSSSLRCYFPGRPPFPPDAPAPIITNKSVETVITKEKKKSSLSGSARTAILLGISPSNLTISKNEQDPEGSLTTTSSSHSQKSKDISIMDDETTQSVHKQPPLTVKKSK